MDLTSILSYIGNALKVDYIVEEKTAGEWNCRKWNSGTSECWLRTNTGQVTLATQLGTDRISGAIKFSYPTAAGFISIPKCFISYEGNSTGYAWVETVGASAGVGTKTQTYPIRLCRIGTSSVVLQNNTFSVYAAGKWK